MSRFFHFLVMLLQMPCSITKTSSNIPAQQAPVHQQLSASSGEASAVFNQSSPANSAPSKPRMRWNPELHEAFVEAVTKLGGSESE